MGLLGLGALLAACDCCPQGEAKALSQDKELRAVMNNFIGCEVPEATPLVEKREAELIRIVSLTVQQSNALLQEEVATALAKGLSPEEILEAIYQCAPYSGFPRAVDAVEIARSVFKAKNVMVDESRATVNAETRPNPPGFLLLLHVRRSHTCNLRSLVLRTKPPGFVRKINFDPYYRLLPLITINHLERGYSHAWIPFAAQPREHARGRDGAVSVAVPAKRRR